MPIGHYNYDASVTFPDRGWQVVAYSCFVICLVINSGIVARRMEQTKRVLTTFKPTTSTWLCDLLATLVFYVSFFFIVINGVLTFGIGTNLFQTCDASVVLCVSVFVLAKVLLYLYYLERLFILTWAKDGANVGQAPLFMARFRAKPWLFGMLIFVFGVPCAILLGFSKDFSLVYHAEEGQLAVGCHVFLKNAFAVPTIVWAAIINTYVLIAVFVPMKRGRLSHSSDLEKVVKQTMWSTVVSGVATVINLSVLLILKGEHGIECLLCCSIDVVVNSLVLAIITKREGEEASFPFLFSKTAAEDCHSESYAGADLSPSTSRPEYERKASEASKERMEMA